MHLSYWFSEAACSRMHHEPFCNSNKNTVHVHCTHTPIRAGLPNLQELAPKFDEIKALRVNNIFMRNLSLRILVTDIKLLSQIKCLHILTLK